MEALHAVIRTLCCLIKIYRLLKENSTSIFRATTCHIIPAQNLEDYFDTSREMQCFCGICSVICINFVSVLFPVFQLGESACVHNFDSVHFKPSRDMFVEREAYI
jgi:hypothetical protein